MIHKLYLNGLANSFLPSSLFLGEGVFTTGRLINGIIEHSNAHFNRLHSHADQLGFSVSIPDFQEELAQACIDLQGFGKHSAKIRLIAVKEGSHSIRIIHISDLPDTPKDIILRMHPSPVVMPLAWLKTISYLDRSYLRRLAEQEGCFDSIIVNEEGYILECSRANIFWKWDETLFYPDPALPYLFGITLDNEINRWTAEQRAAKAIKIRLAEVPLRAEWYVSNCLLGVQRVKSISQ